AVGMVATEEYGSKMLQIGGADRLTGKDGFLVARTIVELANGEAADLTIGRHTRLTVQLGQPPVINGKTEEKMRVGCGSATVGLFARQMKDTADEVIVIDHHVIGLFSEHLAGAEVGKTWSGVLVNATKSSRGRYFGEPGDGIGGTTIAAPRDIIQGADMTIARPGMTIFVTDTTGGVRALFTLGADGTAEEIPLTEKAIALADAIRANCEDSRCSVIYTGGAGGSARGGVCTRPLKLTEAVHAGKAVLTIGGAPAFVLPGGGINFMVDAGQVTDHAFTWVPTPATVAPVEYTMTCADYAAIGGHLDQIISKDSLQKSEKR
ncbi:MAG: 6-hydroxynicotinate reductase, partial [Butyricicoccus sp.]